MKPSYRHRGGASGEGAGGAHPTSRSPRDDLRLPNTTSILQKKKTLWFIGAEVKHERRLKNYVKRRKIVVKMVVPKPGSDAELFMSRTQFEVRPTQIIKTG